MFTILELYSYASKVRRSFAQRIAALPPELVERNREASFYTMKNILLHMIDNEDWIVGWVIHGRSREYVRRKSAEYTNIAMVLDHLDEVESRTLEYLKSADEAELNRRVDFVLSSGESFNLSVEESLFQSFTEQMYHLGELIALLWQEDIEPPRMQWFWNNPREKGFQDHEIVRF
ncbi:MAG TPA: DinB family protein [Terriglobales bacterium]|nr:DinB family protein [Terriglobales bacterium]